MTPQTLTIPPFSQSTTSPLFLSHIILLRKNNPPPLSSTQTTRVSTVTLLPPIPTPAIVPPIQTTPLILDTPSLAIPSPRVDPTLIPTSQPTQDPPSPSNPVPTPRVGSTLISVFQSETIKPQTTLTTNNIPITPRNKLIVVFPSITPPPVSRPKLRQSKHYSYHNSSCPPYL